MAVTNSLAKKPQAKAGITAFLSSDKVKEQINNALGSMNSQRFVTSIVSAVNNNPALGACSNTSILTSALLGEALNLSPSPQLGHYYLVPFNDNKSGGKVAQFQLGYKGYIQLAIRSGQYKKLNVMAIKEGELVVFNPLEEEIQINLIEDFETRAKTPTIGYYAFFELTNGFRKAIYWSKAQMEAHALEYSKGYKAKKGYTFWEKNFDGMAYKTMLRQLISKWGIMSIDMQNAYDKDMAVINEDGSKDYVDNPHSAEADVYDVELLEPNESAPQEEKSVDEAQNAAQMALFE